MQQIYTCPGCQSPVNYGDSACGNCGIALDWGIPQSPPPSYNEQDWGQQQGWQQPPPYNQFPVDNQMQGFGYSKKTWQQNKYVRSLVAMVKGWGVKKSLLALMAVLIVVAGIAVVAGGKSSTKPAGTTPASEQAPASAPAAAEPPVIMSFKVNPAAVKAGESTNLSWEVNKATSVSIDQGIGTVSASGTRPVSPKADTTYTITATNSAGSVTAATSVSINVPLVPVVISFTATPGSVKAGQPVKLQWYVTGATSISIDQGIGIVSASLEQDVLPTKTTTYTLVATNRAGSVTATATVTIGVATPPAITRFTVTPNSIAAGDTATLQWDVSGATSVSINQDIGTVPSSGTRDVSPAATTTYTLTARNNVDSVTRSITVTMGTATAPVVDRFSAIPGSITAGESSTLQWNVTGATSVSIDQDIGTVAASGTKGVTPTVTTKYTITATNSFGTTTRSVDVAIIIIPPPVIDSFTAYTANDPSNASDNISIHAGQAVTLKWQIRGAESISIVGSDNRNITPPDQFSSEVVVYPTDTTTTYRLTATNSAGSEIKTVTVIKQ